MVTTHHVMTVSGARIHYWLSGPTTAPTVACTHGLSMDHRMFDSQIPSLVKAGYRVLTWDMSGHGASKPMKSSFSVPAEADRLAHLLSEVGAEKAVLLGHSLGGFVSQELLYHQPERVSALVTIGNNSLTMPLPSTRRFALRVSPLIFAVRGDGWRKKMVSEGTAVRSEVKRYAYEATGRLTKAEFIKAWVGLSRSLRPRSDYRIPCPVLIVHGEEDGAGDVARDARKWADREPEAEQLVVPRAGHNANQDNSDFFNSALLGFLARCPDGSPPS